MATATKPGVKKRLADLAAGGGPDDSAQLICKNPECGKEFYVFGAHRPELCPTCDWEQAEARAQELTDKANGKSGGGAEPLAPNPRPPNSQPAAAVPRRIALADLARNRFNPRQDFPRGELEELAESFKTAGQLQPVVVRRAPATPFLESIGDRNRLAEWEIVAGERRALAAKMAGWTEIDVVVRECDDATAAKLAIEENFRRKDISQIEFARGVKRRMELAGLDVAGVAADLKLDVSTVRNLFRLLDAPEAWQRRVISREMTGTHLRHALPYLHAPEIEKALAAAVDEAVKESGGLNESEKKWEGRVRDIVREKAAKLARTVSTRDPYHYGEVRIDKNHPDYAALDVVSIKPKWGGNLETFALNAPLARKILSEKVSAWKARHAGAEKKAKGKTAKAPTPAEAKKIAQAEAAARKEAWVEFAFDWHCWLCAQAIAFDEQNALLAVATAGLGIGALFDEGWEIGRREVASAFPKTPGYGLAVKWLAAPVDERVQIVLSAARALFWDASENETAAPEWQRADAGEELARWCELLSIDPAAAWRAKGDDGQAFAGPLTDRFFELAEEQGLLKELAAEWKVTLLEKDKDAEIVKKLRNRPERVLPLPRVLADVAGGVAKKRKAK